MDICEYIYINLLLFLFLMSDGNERTSEMQIGIRFGDLDCLEDKSIDWLIRERRGGRC